MKLIKHRFNTVYAVTMLLLIGANLSLVIVSILALSRQSRQSAAAEGDFLAGTLEDLMETVDSSLRAEILYDEELNALIDGITEVEDYQRVIDVQNKLRTLASTFETPVNFFGYFPRGDYEVFTAANQSTYIVWSRIHDRILSRAAALSEGKRRQNRWTVEVFDNVACVIRTFVYGDKILGCWILAEDLTGHFQFSSLGGKISAALLGEEGEILFSEGDARSRFEQEIWKEGDFTLSRGGDMLISRKLAGADFQIAILAEDFSQASGLLRLQIFFLSLLAGAVLLLLNLFMNLQKSVVQPIQKFNEEIARVSEDETYTVETSYYMQELSSASALLSELVDRVKSLRITLYEQELEKQKIENDYLTLQIAPHFYLNCLNIVYAMAEMRQNAEIKKLIGVISAYLRYSFKNLHQMVSVSDELSHIEAYLEIQKIRYEDQFDYEISFSEEAGRAAVPPFLLQTFAENAIKHAMRFDRPIFLSLSGQVTDLPEDALLPESNDAGEDMPFRLEKDAVSRYKKEIVLVIADTGEGFAPEILRKLKEGIPLREGDARIGIDNCRARVEAFYGKEGRILFENPEGGGARVSVILPYRPLCGELSEAEVFTEGREV